MDLIMEKFSDWITRKFVEWQASEGKRKTIEDFAEQVKQILQSFIHKILAKKTDGQITGSITYYTPPLADLLRPPDPPPGDSMLPISSRPVGAPLYRQTFTHPIVCPKKKKPLS